MDWKFMIDYSSLAGYISILFWLIVFIPQLQENYKRKNGDGLSITFLIIWLAGDIFNLAGIIMEKLMFTMFLLALWYTVADIGLIWQVVYYKQCVTTEIDCDQDEAIVLLTPKQLKKRRISKDTSLKKLEITSLLERQQQQSEESEEDNHDELLDEEIDNSNNIYTVDPKMKSIWVNLIGASILILMTLFSCYAYYFMISTQSNHDDDSFKLIPQILGWLSAVLYVGSRLPQLIKNWKQQSTEGLSSGMFICAVFGNIFFALSIFLKSTERRYILVNLPWIIGSLGTVIFDIMIFLQFYVFNRRKMKHRAD